MMSFLTSLNEARNEVILLSDLNKQVESEEVNITSANDITRIKTKIIHTVIWCAYFIVGVVITIVAMLIQKDIAINFSPSEVPIMVLMFLSINAQKYIGLIGAVGVFFAIKRKSFPKYFAFIFGFYTILLIFAIIGVIIL